MPGTILLHRDPETKESLYFQIACGRRKTSDYNTVVKSSQISSLPPSSPSSHLAFHFFLFLPKKELRHADKSEPGTVRRKLMGGVPEVTVRSMFISQVSWRGRHCGAERLAELLTAGLEPGTREN